MIIIIGINQTSIQQKDILHDYLFIENGFYKYGNSPSKLIMSIYYNYNWNQYIKRN
jgi:hypothetical protein